MFIKIKYKINYFTTSNLFSIHIQLILYFIKIKRNILFFIYYFNYSCVCDALH